MVGAAAVGGGGLYTGMEWVGPSVGMYSVVAMGTAYVVGS